MSDLLPGSEAEARLEMDWRLFTASTFLFIFGFNCYGGVFQNFMKDVFHASPVDLGGLESVREIPGLLAALMAGTLVALAETRIAAIGLAITAIGVGATGNMGSIGSLVAITVLWSIGFHIYAPVSSAITLALSKGKEGGRHLGRMSAVGAFGTVAGLALATALSRYHVDYKIYYWLGGVAIMASALLISKLSTHAVGGSRQPIIFRREYGLFYLLTFLEGCRRQIFAIFASLALILVYHVDVQWMLIIQLVNAVMIAVTAPRIGKLVDKVGEREPLTFYAIGLIVVFLGYSVTKSVGALIALFLIDNILFTFGIGFTTYLHRIVRLGELTPCLAMGVTMNHVAAVTVPIGGAILWERYHNYQVPFWVGVAIAAISLVATRWLPAGRGGGTVELAGGS